MMTKARSGFTKNSFYFMGSQLYNSLTKAIKERDNDFEKK